MGQVSQHVTERSPGTLPSTNEQNSQEYKNITLRSDKILNSSIPKNINLNTFIQDEEEELIISNEEEKKEEAPPPVNPPCAKILFPDRLYF